MAAGNDEDEGGGGGDRDPDHYFGEVNSNSGGRRSAEKALEEAASTGNLNLSGRRLKELPCNARSADLTDITRADLSKNRFSEVPGDICQLVSLESLNLHHNCLRTLPSAIENLQALTYLNISRNLLSSLPSCLCRLPLNVLIASNNKLTSLPEDVGGMTNLRQLDVSCNDLQTLPPQVGSLESLRDLNVRRNQLTVLPEELSELPLIRLDFSCNRVIRIPVCYRHLRHLQSIILDNNPLQYPPAQICLKGKVHIFKYLNIEACSKPMSDLGGFEKLSRPTSFTTCLTDDIYSARPYGGLDSGFNSVDSGSKRWSGNESADEFSDLSFRIAGLGRDTRQLREKQNGEGDTEHVDFIESSTNEEDEDTKSDCGLHMTVTPQDKRKPDQHSTPRTEERTLICGPIPSPPSPGSRQDLPAEERRRPETLLLWKERERQQLQQKQDAARRQSVDRKESLLKSVCHPSPTQNDVASASSENGIIQQPRLRSQGTQAGTPNPTSPTSLSTDPSQISNQKPSSFLFRSYSRGAVRNAVEQSSTEQRSPVRLRNTRSPLDEKSLLTQLRKEIESHLNITLWEPLGECLANGVTLCQLLNHLRPRTIPFIHVPSPAVPKLNPVKCRRNVDNFLDACRRIGVPERDLCLASDILGGEHPLIVQRTVSSLLLLPPSTDVPLFPAISAPQTTRTDSCSPSLFLTNSGFLLFYTLLMLTLYAVYCKLYLLLAL
ncbi:leucine-rich repeat and calponin homology domain-containing protein 4 [Bombina bombina]|uniref:leucine-rich repeat and calponin homology domain-containing protein 4 n=1 Tax=Bombina bombina TaxID=8345 RepID=UPI00235AADEB|nr:leucine-rich repeat and calponin homology domain-containing protein 4 [Bombina bombina]